MSPPSAAAIASDEVTRVEDDPSARLSLLHGLYEGQPGNARRRLPYRRASAAFMRWQLRRGLLRPLGGSRPGSRWWRAINTRLLRDGLEASELVSGRPGPASSESVSATVEFMNSPSARNWYRAHNMSVVSGYLDNRGLADLENRAERFFINLVLIRVLYAHALVASPRLALSWLAPIAPPLGDPRLGMTSIFLSMSRVLPDRYPLTNELETYLPMEHSFGHLLDVGVILPRLPSLFGWSSAELARPELADLLADGVPVYAWDPAETEPWRPQPSLLARTARRALPSNHRS